ncbi:purine-cytosine permease family protein [Streptomyces cyanogenus]|uniref:Permease for cytosine/purines, uracil, thiamine, allantoin n=1 Tax=Streptomyces cyanogenus TaxID=80860 RepID=A0ABX7TPU6_STRCY|nr:cytosine permease [Streptomyces cyanogenus]QTD98606.1 Permease for cytosine/purines, uracil, thiamine, allantoin [Streptomyces cyanogenus]
MSTSAEPRVSGLEIRSIDYVPLDERHGKLWHLGPLWFMSNAQIATLAVGLVSITQGGNLVWSLLAIVSGTVIGTFFMAFHSAQGPQLGLPQMIQSRPQFGYVGALLVWLFAYVQYAGFNVFNSILAADSLHTTLHGGVRLWVIVVTAVALVIALVGYDIIHKAERILTYTFLVIFGIFTVGVAVTLHYPAGSFDLGGFKWTPFLAQFGVVAGYQISWAIYVSDYSRYLPPDVTVRKTFYWTYFGSALGGIWLMVLGALLAAWAGPKTFQTIPAINSAGDKVFTGFGAVVLLFSALGLVSVTALNMYGGSLTLISAIDSFKRVRPTLAVRLVTLALTAALSLVGALAATSNFLENFENFLLLVLYLFIPWTAVNLMDYYVVRRGHYAVAEIFNPHGIYGRWGWHGIVAYLVGFGAMIPFFSVGTLFLGPAAKALGGADISLFVGLPVSALLYWWLSRSIDVEAETRLAEAEAAALEQAAHEHREP